MDKTEDNTTQQVQAATEILSYKWHAVVIKIVKDLDGARYSEINSKIDQISSKMLSDALSELTDRGILNEVKNAGEDSGVNYELTLEGRHFAKVLGVLIQWHTLYNEQRPSILIIEDDPMASSALSDYSSNPFNVRTVSRGEDGIRHYTKDTDLVILDRKLDDISGDTVATKIKEKDQHALILVVSGIDPKDNILDLPVDCYLKKPVSRTELRSRISDILNRQGLELEQREYLALRSKQSALIETHGASALGLQSYDRIEQRINNIELSENMIEILEANMLDNQEN
ncbi:winged helix-turn-helix transcriptional regulator [Halorubrum sp. ARQ200]|uniref:winged helix-turn-helix transcriptional regulator n=1 Tax=Halorubrum sp. ARQ200 TaxID=1855872 RepID=UPI0010F75341|nr:winged helix-turn-helix transcriptional regulator [Halorubrum sp. ARQ200]TKX43697.1 response regulator [Halorubrum sp. ARQ200]